jgi:hypothetical protein
MDLDHSPSPRSETLVTLECLDAPSGKPEALAKEPNASRRVPLLALQVKILS